jgi:hypothetical protein
VPMLLLLGGLAILAVGLVLLTGGTDGRRTTGPTYGSGVAPAGSTGAWTAIEPAPPASTNGHARGNGTAGALGTVVDHDTAPDPLVAAIAPAAPPAAPTPPPPAEPCDWSAWFEHEDGRRVLLRGAEGRTCCTYVLRVRDLDPVTGPTDQLDEVLCWSGAATRIGPSGASTPLQRDVVTRRAASSHGALFAALSLDRSPGPEVTTPGWRDEPMATAGEEGTHDNRRAQLWSRHIDELRDHGARPIPADSPRVPPLEHRRRVEASLSVQRGCRTAPHPAVAEGSCHARLGGSLAPTGQGRLGAPLLASWIEVDDRVVVADEATVPPTGLGSWHPVVEDPARGIAAAGDPRARTTEAEWTGRVRTDVDERAATVRIGSAVRLEVTADDDAPGRVAAELHASTAAHVRLRVAAPEGDDGGCRRCVPSVEVTLGRPDVHGVRSDERDSTAEAVIRLDARSFRLHPPVPGTGARSWTVATGDLGVSSGVPPTAQEVTR